MQVIPYLYIYIKLFENRILEKKKAWKEIWEVI